MFVQSLPKLNVYGKEQHPQGNHLHQRQGGGGLRQADTFRGEQARERAEPHGHRIGRVSTYEKSNATSVAFCFAERARFELAEEFQDTGAGRACVWLLRTEPAWDVQPRCRFGAKCRQKHLDQPGLQRVPI